MDYNSSLSTDEEDYEGILKPALEVKLSDDFNPNSTPRDGKFNTILKHKYTSDGV